MSNVIQDPAVLTLVCKCMLGNNADLDMTAQPWVQFSNTITLVRCFVQPECTEDRLLYLESTREKQRQRHTDTDTDRDRQRQRLHLFHAPATFIMQNRRLYTTRKCAPCRITMDMDKFQSYTEKGLFTIRCGDRSWGGVWSDMVGCCFLLKLEYYSSENLLKFISNKMLISPA